MKFPSRHEPTANVTHATVASRTAGTFLSATRHQKNRNETDN
ncbi:hypothetical protein BLAT2472_30451 [Burkholderia latens]